MIGRYVVEAEAGAGGGGLVLAARDPELARRVAIRRRGGAGARSWRPALRLLEPVAAVHDSPRHRWRLARARAARAPRP